MEKNPVSFKLGKLVATPGALDLQEKGVDLTIYLKRHARGDWGDLSAFDKQENNFSVENGYRILSNYKTMHGPLWIITEADRSATTFLLPDEY